MRCNPLRHNSTSSDSPTGRHALQLIYRAFGVSPTDIFTRAYHIHMRIRELKDGKKIR